MQIHVYNVCPINQDSTLCSWRVVAEADRPTMTRLSGDAAIQERPCLNQDVRFPLQIFFVYVERLHGKSQFKRFCHRFEDIIIFSYIHSLQAVVYYCRWYWGC
jgi:hypothetical protein